MRLKLLLPVFVFACAAAVPAAAQEKAANDNPAPEKEAKKAAPEKPAEPPPAPDAKGGGKLEAATRTPKPARKSKEEEKAISETATRRALAWDRKDMVAELVFRPHGVSLVDPASMARQLGIPLKHAQQIVQSAGRLSATKMANSQVLMRDVIGRMVGSSVGLPSDLKIPKDVTAKWVQENLGIRDAKQAQALEARIDSMHKSAQRFTISAKEAKVLRAAQQAKGRYNAERWAEVLRGIKSGDLKRVGSALGVGQSNTKIEGLRNDAAKKEIEARRVGKSVQARADKLAVESAQRNDPLSQKVGTNKTAERVLGEFRDSKGRLVSAEGLGEAARHFANGMAHFALALFLKEVVVARHTGDTERLEAVMEHLLSPEFIESYFAFAASATAADKLYGAALRRVAQQRVLAGIGRYIIVLGAGIGIPMVVKGQWDTETFVVDVAALGLSAAMVKGAMEAIEFAAKRSGALRLGGQLLSASKLGNVKWLAKAGGAAGWLLTVGETALVLLIADEISGHYHQYKRMKAAREKVEEANQTLAALTKRYEASEPVADDELFKALKGVEDAYDGLRSAHFARLQLFLHGLYQELDDVGRSSVQSEAVVSAAASSLEKNEQWAKYYAKRYGSVDGYLDSLRGKKSDKAEKKVAALTNDFDQDWNKLFSEVMTGDAKQGEPLAGRGGILESLDQQSQQLLQLYAAASDEKQKAGIAQEIAKLHAARAMHQDNLYTSGSDQSGIGQLAEAQPTEPAAGASGRLTAAGVAGGSGGTTASAE